MGLYKSKKFLRAGVFFAAGLTLALILSAAPRAQELWVEYQSDSGIFTARIPEEHAGETSLFYIADERAVGSEEIFALLDQRPYRDVIKSYIIRADQTIGGGLNSEEIAILLERELNLFEDFYVAHGGRVVSRDIGSIQKYPIGELLLTYDDPVFGKQFIKAFILFSTSTRLEQIMVGPEATLNSYITKDFFQSLKFYDGITVQDDKIKEVWEPQTSPLGLFTVYVPPLQKPFFTESPLIKHSKKAEVISLKFKDPVRNQSIYYNVHGYNFDQPLTRNIAEAILRKNYITKHQAKDAANIRFSEGIDARGRTVLETTYNITSPKDLSFLQSAKLYAVFDKQHMIVQEVLSSQILVFSPFVQNLFQLLEFHPERYREPATGGDEMTVTAYPQKKEGDDISLTDKLMSTLGVKPPASSAPAPPSSTPVGTPPPASP